MKPVSSLLPIGLAFAAIWQPSAATSLRAECGYAPTPTPTPTTSPLPTTPLEFPVVFYGASSNEIFTWGEPPLDKCFGWGGCFRQELAAVRWQALGPAGSTIRFYATGECQGDAFDTFPADAPSGTATPATSAYRTFVVVASPDAAIDRSDALGCRK